MATGISRSPESLALSENRPIDTSRAFGSERHWRRTLVRYAKGAIGIVCVAGIAVAADLASSSHAHVNVSRAPNSAIADPWTAPLPLRSHLKSPAFVG